MLLGTLTLMLVFSLLGYRRRIDRVHERDLSQCLFREGRNQRIHELVIASAVCQNHVRLGNRQLVAGSWFIGVRILRGRGDDLADRDALPADGTGDLAINIRGGHDAQRSIALRSFALGGATASGKDQSGSRQCDSSCEQFAVVLHGTLHLCQVAIENYSTLHMRTVRT